MNRINVISLPRTGSTYFYRMLTRYTYGYNSGWPMGWGEWFNQGLIERQAERENKTYDEVRSWRLSVWENAKGMVIKTQMNFLQDEDVLNICTDSNIYNIFFYRRNIFDMAMSMQIAHHTDEYVHYTNTDSLVVDKDKLFNCVNYYMREYERIKNNVYGIKFKEIVAYEDLTFCEDIDFHNLNISHELSYKTKKAPNKKRVENYDELEDSVQNEYGDKLIWDYYDK